MLKVNIVDNLTKKTRSLTDEEARKISDFIKANILASDEGEYSKKDIDYLTDIKTPELIKNRAEDGFTVFLTNDTGGVVACGMIVKRKGRYEAKYLHVRKDYRGQGLARKVCDIREDRLRQTGVKELYIESLKFKNTLRFHRLRGFKETSEKTSKGLVVVMKKKL